MKQSKLGKALQHLMAYVTVPLLLLGYYYTGNDGFRYLYGVLTTLLFLFWIATGVAMFWVRVETGDEDFLEGMQEAFAKSEAEGDKSYRKLAYPGPYQYFMRFLSVVYIVATFYLGMYIIGTMYLLATLIALGVASAIGKRAARYFEAAEKP